MTGSGARPPSFPPAIAWSACVPSVRRPTPTFPLAPTTPPSNVGSSISGPSTGRSRRRSTSAATPPVSGSSDTTRRPSGVRLLRRPAVRQRSAPPWPPAHRLREGRRPPVPDHAGQSGRAAFRLGLPRPPGRDGSREAVGTVGPSGHRRGRDRHLQRLLPHLGHAVHRRVGEDRRAAGPLGRLRQRLQDHGPALHGVGHVGLQGALRQGAHLRGLPRRALLLGGRDAAVELRDPPRRCHPAAPGPGHHRRVRSDPGRR